MALHDKLTIGPYTLECVGGTQDSNLNYNSWFALLDVYKGGQKQFQMAPEKRVYLATEQPQTMVAIHSVPSWDLYVVYEGTNPDTGRPIIKAFLNPLVSWIWAGLMILVFGTLVALVPSTEPGDSRPARAGSNGARRAGAEGRPTVKRSTPLTLCFRALQAGALAVAVCFSLGATRRRFALQRPESSPDVHLRLREILGECNHVGCPNSDQRAERAAHRH